MEVFTGIIGIITLIGGLIILVAVLSIADNTKKTTKLLKLLLNEKNPERFTLNKFGNIRDTKTGKKI
jgi:hypothetical protein